MNIKRVIISPGLFINLTAQSFSIARIHYSGGGDWYSNASSLPNLLNYVKSNTPMSVDDDEIRIKLTDENLNQYPYMYLNGHGNIKLSNKEIIALRSSLLNGGFLHADDNYGMDQSFRKLIIEMFPEKELVEIPPSHDLFNIYYKFPNGLPKIHEHDNQRPQALGIFHNDQLILLYTYESDLGAGWEDPKVHNNPQDLREQALRMGTNIVMYALTQ